MAEKKRFRAWSETVSAIGGAVFTAGGRRNPKLAMIGTAIGVLGQTAVPLAESRNPNEWLMKSLVTAPLAFMGGALGMKVAHVKTIQALRAVREVTKARAAAKAAKVAASGKGQAEVLNKAGKKVGKAVFRRINGRIIMIGKK